MGTSNYLKAIRSSIGNSLLMIPGVAAVILNEDHKLLLQEKTGEPWSLPAGMIEPGESPKEAVIREVQEETGLLVSPNKVLGLFGGDQFGYVYPNGDKVEYTIILMKCNIVKDLGCITDSETESVRYFSKNDMPGLALPYPIEVLFDELEHTYM